MMGMIENFEAMLAAGKDTSLLRFSLGNQYLQQQDVAKAIVHLQAAVAHDAGYSAAWKLLGKAQAARGDIAAATAAYTAGIAAANAHGDKQAAKEMAVFLKRLNKAG
jgi:predicted Zn-dependent protease